MWTNKISKLTTEKPENLLAHPLNARRHPPVQRDALRASLKEVGWIAPVIVNETTGHVVDGHARVEEAISNGIKEIPVVYVKLSEQEEANALATFDPITTLATYDQEILLLLAEETEFETEELSNLLQGIIDNDLGDLVGNNEDIDFSDADKNGRTVECPECGHEFKP